MASAGIARVFAVLWPRLPERRSLLGYRVAAMIFTPITAASWIALAYNCCGQYSTIGLKSGTGPARLWLRSWLFDWPLEFRPFVLSAFFASLCLLTVFAVLLAARMAPDHGPRLSMRHVVWAVARAIAASFLAAVLFDHLLAFDWLLDFQLPGPPFVSGILLCVAVAFIERPHWSAPLLIVPLVVAGFLWVASIGFLIGFPSY